MNGLSPELQQAVQSCCKRVQPALGDILRPEAVERVVTIAMAAVYPVASRAALSSFAEGLRIAAEKSTGRDRDLLLDVADMIPPYDYAEDTDV